MSGGFSDSPYLFSRVQEWGRARNIEVERGDEGYEPARKKNYPNIPSCVANLFLTSWGAVVRGAVLRGAGLGAQIPTPMGIVPRNYGICVSQYFQGYKGHDPRRDAVVDKLQGVTLAKEQIVWLVRKGDMVGVDEPIVSTYDVSCAFTPSDISNARVMRIVFVATTGERETRLSEVVAGRFVVPEAILSANEVLGGHETINLDAHFSKIPSHHRHKQQKSNSMFSSYYYKAFLKVEVRVDSRVRVSIKCGSRVLAKGETNGGMASLAGAPQLPHPTLPYVSRSGRTTNSHSSSTLRSQQDTTAIPALPSEVATPASSRRRSARRGRTAAEAYVRPSVADMDEDVFLGGYVDDDAQELAAPTTEEGARRATSDSDRDRSSGYFFGRI